MARPEYRGEHVNQSLTRERLESLQETLIAACEQALSSAMEAGEIPSSLLSSTNVILKDVAKLSADMRSDEERAADEGRESDSPSWTESLVDELGFNV